jgi:hypothetical protein
VKKKFESRSALFIFIDIFMLDAIIDIFIFIA